MEEIWKLFKITKTRKYEVSSFGRRRVISIKTNKILKLDYGTNVDGYRFFGRLGQAHRVIAKSFIPNPENKPCVNHIDGNKSNNHVNNLEWCTQSENIQHSFDTGLLKITDETKTKMSIAKRSKTIFTFINKDGLTEECTQFELRRKYDLHQGALSEVCRGFRNHINGWRLQ